MAGSVVMVSSIQLDTIPELQSWLGRVLKDYPSKFDQLFKILSTDRAQNKYAKITGMGMATAMAESEDVTYDTVSEFWTKDISTTRYGIGIIFSEDAMEDLKSGLHLEQKAKGIARAMLKAKEYHAATFIDNSHTDIHGGDGVALCSASHPLKYGGTFSNTLASPADISEACLLQMIRELMDIKDDSGFTLNIQPRELWYSKDGYVEVPRLLQTEGQPYTPDNTINVIKSEALIPGGGKLNPYFQDMDALYLTTDAVPAEQGLVHIVRHPLQLASENVFDNLNHKFRGVSKWTNAALDPSCIFGNTGAP